MSKNNRERQAEFKQRMRDSGRKQITVWVTAAQEAYIRDYLAAEAKTEETQPLAGEIALSAPKISD